MPGRSISGASFRALARVVAIFAVTLLAVAAKPAGKQSGTIAKERYLSPLEMISSLDGRLLYVVCQDSDEVRVVDVPSSKVIGSVAVGRMPRGIALSPDGSRLYITNAWSDTVSVIDTAVLQVVQTLPTGRKSRSSTRRGKWWSSASSSTTWLACFILRYRPTEGWVWPRNSGPRI